MGLQQIGVLGLGLLGRGIVANCLGRGFQVVAYTRHQSTFDSARQYLQQALDDLVTHGVITSESRAIAMERYREVHQLADLRSVDFVIETVTEDQQIKRDLYDQLEQIIVPRAIFERL